MTRIERDLPPRHTYSTTCTLVPAVAPAFVLYLFEFFFAILQSPSSAFAHLRAPLLAHEGRAFFAAGAPAALPPPETFRFAVAVAAAAAAAAACLPLALLAAPTLA